VTSVTSHSYHVHMAHADLHTGLACLFECCVYAYCKCKQQFGKKGHCSDLLICTYSVPQKHTSCTFETELYLLQLVWLIAACRFSSPYFTYCTVLSERKRYAFGLLEQPAQPARPVGW
jgi:hypothetical protein